VRGYFAVRYLFRRDRHTGPCFLDIGLAHVAAGQSFATLGVPDPRSATSAHTQGMSWCCCICPYQAIKSRLGNLSSRPTTVPSSVLHRHLFVPHHRLRLVLRRRHLANILCSSRVTFLNSIFGILVTIRRCTSALLNIARHRT
jgi:hypothetical protein